MGWIMQVAGAGIGAAGQLAQGKQDEATAKQNAQLANFQADDALTRGALEEKQYRRQLAQLIGKQKTAIASRNVEASGSALNLLEDSAQLGEEDALMIRNNAAREAWSYKNQANEQSRYGKNAKQNAGVNAGSTLLTGGAQAYGTWAQGR